MMQSRNIWRKKKKIWEIEVSFVLLLCVGSGLAKSLGRTSPAFLPNWISVRRFHWLRRCLPTNNQTATLPCPIPPWTAGTRLCTDAGCVLHTAYWVGGTENWVRRPTELSSRHTDHFCFDSSKKTALLGNYFSNYETTSEIRKKKMKPQ